VIILKGIAVAIFTVAASVILAAAFAAVIALSLYPFRIPGNRVWTYTENGNALI
jgi:hypothetical protein